MKKPAQYASTSSERADGKHDGRARAVLVVDDERLVADTLSLIFQRAGFKTYTAYGAQEAQRLASVNAPDILLSDVDMPGVSGVDLAMSILANNPNCKVILFSGHASVSDLARAKAAGYEFPLLAKPIHPQVLLESVSKRLGVAIPAELRVAPSVQADALTWNA